MARWRRESGVEQTRGPAVRVPGAEDDGDQGAAVAGRGGDERVPGLVGEAGLEAGGARVQVLAHQLVVVDERVVHAVGPGEGDAR